MKLINMKMSPKEAKDETGGCVSSDGGPAYPYGLEVRLNDEVLQKLGMTELPPVGTKMQLFAMVEVTSASQYENQDGKDISVCLQITDMGLAAETKPSKESLMYPNSKMN